MNVAEYILIAFPAMLVILNPLMAASSFMSMTQDLQQEVQYSVARKACLTAFIVLVIFAAAGQFIFQMFNITVEAFRIAGGIILFNVGFRMLKLQPLRIKQTEEEKEESYRHCPVGDPNHRRARFDYHDHCLDGRDQLAV